MLYLNMNVNKQQK